MYSNNHLENYQDFLEQFLDKQYEFVNFQQLNKPYKQIVMRHDIDFDCQAALDLARIEHKLDITSTYFFLLSNDSYNPLSKQNMERILEIKELGHTISIHFDPTIYKDFEQGFEQEKAIFETLFQTKIDIISLHRPNEFFLKFDQKFSGVEHTYMQKYFKDFDYFSDSTGLWRFGHPFNSEAFKLSKSLHVLIHPIWWVIEGQDNFNKLKSYYQVKKDELKKHYSDNCLPFIQIANELD